eukprot:624377-Lingulodinium_polyedra.AAC.1
MQQLGWSTHVDAAIDLQLAEEDALEAVVACGLRVTEGHEVECRVQTLAWRAHCVCMCLFRSPNLRSTGRWIFMQWSQATRNHDPIRVLSKGRKHRTLSQLD